MLSVIEINREHDVVYILLRPELRDERGSVARSIRVADDIVLDLDANEKLIGIELLNASARLDLTMQPCSSTPMAQPIQCKRCSSI